MRIRRVLGAVLAATLVAGTVGTVTASPASAATATKIVGTGDKGWLYPSSYKSQPGAPVAGDTLYISIDVASTDGSTNPYSGTVKVERKLAGSSAWKTIATSTYAGYYGTTKAVKNATYRATYSGGTSGSNSWASSTASRAQKVQRKISIDNKGTRKVVLVGKVAPKFKGKVAVLKKQGKRWKTWRKVKVNRKSVFRTTLPRPRNGKFFWNVKVKGGNGFVPSQTGKFYTYSY